MKLLHSNQDIKHGYGTKFNYNEKINTHNVKRYLFHFV